MNKQRHVCWGWPLVISLTTPPKQSTKWRPPWRLFSRPTRGRLMTTAGQIVQGQTTTREHKIRGKSLLFKAVLTQPAVASAKTKKTIRITRVEKKAAGGRRRSDSPPLPATSKCVETVGKHLDLASPQHQTFRPLQDTPSTFEVQVQGNSNNRVGKAIGPCKSGNVENCVGSSRPKIECKS